MMVQDLLVIFNFFFREVMADDRKKRLKVAMYNKEEQEK